MDELEQQVQTLARRVELLEQQNAELRERLRTDEEPRPAERRFDRRNLLRLGGAAAAVGAGSVLLRPDGAGATTAAMSFGAENDAGTDTTGLTSTNGTDTLHVANTASGEALNVQTTNTANAKAALHVVDAGLGGAIFAEANNNSDQAAAAIFAGGINGGGVLGVTAGSGFAVGGLGGTGTGPGVVAAVFDTDADTLCMEAGHLGLGICLYSHIENAAQRTARGLGPDDRYGRRGLRQHPERVEQRGRDGGGDERKRARHRRREQQGRRWQVQRQDRGGPARAVNRVDTSGERLRRSAVRRQVQAPLVLPGRHQLEAARLRTRRG